MLFNGFCVRDLSWKDAVMGIIINFLIFLFGRREKWNLGRSSGLSAYAQNFTVEVAFFGLLWFERESVKSIYLRKSIRPFMSSSTQFLSNSVVQTQLFDELLIKFMLRHTSQSQINWQTSLQRRKFHLIIANEGMVCRYTAKFACFLVRNSSSSSKQCRRSTNHHDALKFYVPQHLYFILLYLKLWRKFFIYIHKPGWLEHRDKHDFKTFLRFRQTKESFDKRSKLSPPELRGRDER